MRRTWMDIIELAVYADSRRRNGTPFCGHLDSGYYPALFRLQLFIDWRHHTSPLTRGLSRPAGRMVATAQPKTVDHEKMWISLKVCDQGCDHQYRTVVG